MPVKDLQLHDPLLAPWWTCTGRRIGLNGKATYYLDFSAGDMAWLLAVGADALLCGKPPLIIPLLGMMSMALMLALCGNAHAGVKKKIFFRVKKKKKKINNKKRYIK